MKKPIYKRKWFIAVIISVLLIALIGGCSGESEPTAEEIETADTELLLTIKTVYESCLAVEECFGDYAAGEISAIECYNKVTSYDTFLSTKKEVIDEIDVKDIGSYKEAVEELRSSLGGYIYTIENYLEEPTLEDLQLITQSYPPSISEEYETALSEREKFLSLYMAEDELEKYMNEKQETYKLQ